MTCLPCALPRDDVPEPGDHVRLVRQHLVVAGIARSVEIVRTGTGRHIHVRVDAHQPDALDRLHQVAGVGRVAAEGVAALLVGAASALRADLEFAPAPDGLGLCLVERVVLVAVGAVRRLEILVGRFRHQAMLVECLGDAGIAHLLDFLGAVRVVDLGPGTGVIARCAVAIATFAVDGLRKADAPRVRVEAEVIGLPAGTLQRPVRVVVAGRGEELQAVLGRVVVQHLLQSAHMHRLAVVGEVAGQGDELHTARHGIVERGQEREVVFVEQARRRHLRVHQADGGLQPRLGVEHAGKRAILEGRIDIVEMDVGHEGDLHAGLGFDRWRGGRGRGRRLGRRGGRRLRDRRIASAATGDEHGNGGGGHEQCTPAQRGGREKFHTEE